MPNGFLEVPDYQLCEWSKSFSGNLTKDPAMYGVTVEQAATYAALHDVFAAALQNNLPAVRSMVSTTIKNKARAELVADARLLANLINGQKTVTDSDKVGLGLPVRSRPSRAAVPDETPGLEIVSVRGHTVAIKLGRATIAGHKPPRVLGATLFSYVGEEPPVDFADWRFVGNFGKNTIELDFPTALPPGAKVWLSAQWINTRLQGGPLCQAVMTHLQGGQSHMRLGMAA